MSNMYHVQLFSKFIYRPITDAPAKATDPYDVVKKWIGVMETPVIPRQGEIIRYRKTNYIVLHVIYETEETRNNAQRISFDSTRIPHNITSVILEIKPYNLHLKEPCDIENVPLINEIHRTSYDHDKAELLVKEVMTYGK